MYVHKDISWTFRCQSTRTYPRNVQDISWDTSMKLSRTVRDFSGKCQGTFSYFPRYLRIHPGTFPETSGIFPGNSQETRGNSPSGSPILGWRGKLGKREICILVTGAHHLSAGHKLYLPMIRGRPNRKYNQILSSYLFTLTFKFILFNIHFKFLFNFDAL